VRVSTALRPSPEWTLVLEEGRLILSGGADALFLVDEVAGEAAAELARAFAADRLDAIDRSQPGVARALLRLERIGAVVRARPAPAAPLAVSRVGAPPELASLISQLGGPAMTVGDGGALTVVVRTTGTLAELSERCAAIAGPHLLVDVGHRETIVLGPMVWPGETACVSCLAGRIVRAWGDPPSPPSPRAADARALVAAIVVEELRRFAREGDCPRLVERTIAIDLPTWRTRTERVHRLPWCPRCFPAEATKAPHGAGSFALPWTEGGTST
jgi:bacteriocin biosynthesis cyclodehydratase domain-containing protein